MYLLAIDTATNSGGVALSRNREVVGSIMIKTPLRYSDNLIAMVDFVLEQHELELRDVQAIAVAIGPGSFTGLRIGLATVKAFGQSLKIPAVGVSTLEALAYRFREIHPQVAVMIDARRQQIYGASYRLEGGLVVSQSREAVGKPADWLKNLALDGFIFAGDGSRLYRQTILAVYPGARVLESDNCILKELCQLGCERFALGRAQSVDELKANYVRPSDAELGVKGCG